MAPTANPRDWFSSLLSHATSQPTKTAWFSMNFSMNPETGAVSRAHQWGMDDRTLGGTGIEKTAGGQESGYEFNPFTGAWEGTDLELAQNKMGQQLDLLSRLDQTLAPLLEAWNIDKYSTAGLDKLQGQRETFTNAAGGQSTVLRRTMPNTGLDNMWSMLMPAFQPGGCLVPSVFSTMFPALPPASVPAVSSAPSHFAPTMTAPTITATT